MDILIENIRDWIANNLSHNNHSAEIMINGLWRINCLFRPNIKERIFNYNIIVAQTRGQGSCYYDSTELADEDLKSLIGSHYKGQIFDNLAIDIALLDSIANSFCFRPNKSISLSGNHSSKALARAQIIVTETLRLSNKMQSKKICVCNVGVVSLLIERLLEKGFQVLASDYDPDLIGKYLYNAVNIQSGIETLKIITESDIAIVSGMALSTQTLNDIILTAKLSGTKIILFAETGASFAPFYIKSGIDIVISEPFPFYTFDGETKINIYRSQQ